MAILNVFISPQNFFPSSFSSDDISEKIEAIGRELFLSPLHDLPSYFLGWTVPAPRRGQPSPGFWGLCPLAILENHSRTTLFSLSCVIMSNCPSVLDHALCKRVLRFSSWNNDKILLEPERSLPSTSLLCSPFTAHFCRVLTVSISSPLDFTRVRFLFLPFQGNCSCHPMASFLSNLMANSQSSAYSSF